VLRAEVVDDLGAPVLAERLVDAEGEELAG
jgi:hypothetical protein